MSFKRFTLGNGLNVVSEYRPQAESVAIGFFVKAGARDETPEISGVSHFLEHMMFKGTQSRSALDITYEMGSLGAQANAFTSEESTVYYMAVLPECFTQAFELLSDMLRPSLDPKEFDVEKKVILEEIALYQDRPTYVLFEHALSTFFGVHPAGNSVLGTIQSISDLSRDQMKEYFDARYSPSNIVISVSGKFDQAVLEDLAKQYCESWENHEVDRSKPEFSLKESQDQLSRKDLNRSHVMLLSPGPSLSDELRYEADILCSILGDSSGSKCFWQLVDSGLCDGASIDSEQMDGIGVLYGYASTTPDRLDEVTGVLNEIMSDPINYTEDDLSRAKTKVRSKLAMQGESNMRRMLSIGFDWMYNENYFSLEHELERLAKVSTSSISDLVKTFNYKPTAQVTMVPE